MNDLRFTRLFVVALVAGLVAGGCTPQDSTSNNPPPSGSGGAPGAGGGVGGEGGNNGSGGSFGDADLGPVVDANRPQDMTIREAEPENLSACQIMRTGPFEPVTGANIFSLGAPPVSVGPKAYRVTLSKVADSFLTIMVPTAGDYVFFTSTLARLVVFEVDGAVVPDRNLMGNIMECPEVKTRVAFRLMPGTYVIRIGAQTIPLVDLVVSQAM